MPSWRGAFLFGRVMASSRPPSALFTCPKAGAITPPDTAHSPLRDARSAV
jgi:hypothetical protein